MVLPGCLIFCCLCFTLLSARISEATRYNAQELGIKHYPRLVPRSTAHSAESARDAPTSAPHLVRRGGQEIPSPDAEGTPTLPSEIASERVRLAKEKVRLQKLVSTRFPDERDLRASWHDRNHFREHGERRLLQAQDELRAFDSRVAKQTEVGTTHIRSPREKWGLQRPGSPMPAEGPARSEVSGGGPRTLGFNSREIRQLQTKHVRQLQSVLRHLMLHPERTPADARRRLPFTPVGPEIREALRRNGEPPERANEITNLLSGYPFRSGHPQFAIREITWRLRLNLPPYRPGRIETPDGAAWLH